MNEESRKKALILAISEYDSPKLPTLDFVKNDGIEVYNILKSHNYEIPDSNKLVGRVKWLEMKTRITKFFQNPNNNWDHTLIFLRSWAARWPWRPLYNNI